MAIAVSVWIPLFGIVWSQNYSGFLALIPGFAGAYAGYLIKKVIVSQ